MHKALTPQSRATTLRLHWATGDGARGLGAVDAAKHTRRYDAVIRRVVRDNAASSRAAHCVT